MRYCGRIGYGATEEIRPGVYEERTEEREYYGDVTRNTRRYQRGESLNDNLELDNVISIVADPFAFEHFSEIRYVIWNGAKWKVKGVEIQYPRLSLTIGGVYNENETGTA
ncbi:MAG: hypothetical protein IJQ81_02905 [Oscillibacter sp.]|nr:hypothetical protein [Oscillibacter sp.]